MKGIVIGVKDQHELKFMTVLLSRLGIAHAPISDEELEDLAMSKGLKSIDHKQRVSKRSIRKKLKTQGK